MQEKDRKINVLLCSPYGKVVGGISRWTGHILDFYKTHQTTVNLKHFYARVRGSYQNTSFFVRVRNGFQAYIPFLIELKQELKKNSYDVVHFTSSASFSLLRDIFALRIAKRKRIKIIIHFRFGRIPHLYQIKNWEQKLIHEVIALADKVIVIDKPSYDTLVDVGYKNIELLANPLTPKVLKLVQDNDVITRQDRKILFAGHMVNTKGIFELIEVCKELPDIKLKMIGKVSDDTKQQILDSAGSDSIEWLEIAGELSFENTIQEMLSAGVFVLPSYTEGFPNVILESMGCACPIVASSVGAIPEMLDIGSGIDYGICIEPKNIKQLKDAIIKMLDNREYALQCGLNAQKRVNKEYSMIGIINKLESIWLSTN